MVGFFPSNPAIGQAIGNYNQGLSAVDIARMQSDAAIQEAQLRARAQQSALQSQAQQNAQVNALREREMTQQGALQNQQLENQRAQTAAQMEWQKALMGANAAEASKDRLSKETIAGTMYGSRNAINPAEIQDANNRTQAMAGRLNFALKSLQEAQSSEEKKVSDVFSKDMSEWSPFTLDATHAAKRDKALGEVQNRYRTQMQQLLQSVPQDSALDFDQTRMQFVPKMIGPASGAPTSFNNPAAVNGDEFRFFNNRGAAPAPPPAETLPTPARGATGVGGATITVRTSDGKVRTGPESAWLKLKAEDPGAEIISAPPPQPTTSSFFQTPTGSPAPNWAMQRMFGQ